MQPKSAHHNIIINKLRIHKGIQINNSSSSRRIHLSQTMSVHVLYLALPSRTNQMKGRKETRRNFPKVFQQIKLKIVIK